MKHGNGLFLLYRKLRRISYQVKSALRGSHCDGTEFVASRPAAGGESCAAGFYFFVKKYGGKCWKIGIWTCNHSGKRI